MKNLAMKELERGREYAGQLQRLILKLDNGEDVDEALTTSYAQDLAVKVEDSLRNAILFLNSQHSTLSAYSPVSFDESNHGSSKRTSPNNNKYGRTCFTKKRKCIQTWYEHTKISPKEDGYSWRKYGEKIILNAKYPRCYFRCSHKYEHGCEATKQVQIIQDNPHLYRTTYCGYHTCTDPKKFLDSHDLSSSTTRFISFDNNQNNNSANFLTKPNHQFFSSPFPQYVKNVEDYCKRSKQLENINDNTVPLSWSNDCLLSPPAEVLPFESNDLMDVISSKVFYHPVLF